MSKLPILGQSLPFPQNPGCLPEVQLDVSHSPVKVLSHKEMLRAFVAGEEVRPIHLRIGLVGACNMRCKFCNFHSVNESQFYDLFSYQDQLSTDESIRLLTEFAEAGGRAVTICGSGENTIHPHYDTICRAAHEHGLKLGLITNGTRLHVKEIHECIVDTHTWVRVGLNASTADTFAEITHYAAESFEKMLATIRPLRREARSPGFRIGLNFVITGDNYGEIVAACHLAKEAGAHYVRYEPEFYSALGHETILVRMDEIARALESAAAAATAEFEVSVPKLDRGPMDRTEAVEGDFHRCHYSRFVTAVGADAHLYPCPQVHLNSRYQMGNVIDRGYLGVLEGGPRREWEAQNPLRTELCKTCFYRPQNELLESLLDGRINLEEAMARFDIEVPDPLHVDFV